ncbi:MAG: hypothetical protein VXZ39_06095 [Planctomycetota bacterium]|nr:hypothetical protein [Planctomycetota bacterium]
MKCGLIAPDLKDDAERRASGTHRFVSVERKGTANRARRAHRAARLEDVPGADGGAFRVTVTLLDHRSEPSALHRHRRDQPLPPTAFE